MTIVLGGVVVVFIMLIKVLFTKTESVGDQIKAEQRRKKEERRAKKN
jgi:hypothetical protein